MKHVLIYGYGKSGKSAEKVLLQKNIQYKIFDDNLKVSGGCYLSHLNKKNILDFDTIILSPGVSIYEKNIQFALRHGVKVISELEFASRMITCPMIAVTGTNGKTTTVHLIKDMLLDFGKKVEVAGNVGVPLCEFIDCKLDYLVVEVSSFQLEAIDKFYPYIAVVLNIDSDHLDRHKTLENYKKAKMNIFKNNDKSTYAIVNGGDKNISCRHLHNVYKFDKDYAGSFAYVKNHEICYMQKKLVSMQTTYFLNSNIDNALATICVGKILNVPDEIIESTLLSYKPLPHRLQLVTEENNVRYYDDSKATNIHAVERALSNFNHSVILLLGGKEKDLDFIPFFKQLSACVYQLITFGEIGSKIAKLAKKYTKVPCKSFTTLKDATIYAKSQAKNGDVVLLSPACSSFDEFQSYEDRGNAWIRYVKGESK